MSNEEQSVSEYPFEFRGKGGEYFKIWIVNVLLSMITLYIYSAWAKVRTNRYFYGNTYVNNSAFEYHAKPTQILKGRIIAVIAFIIYIVANTINPIVGTALLILILAITPWVICRSLMFKARMSSHRNVRFGFSGKSGPLYLYILLVPFLPLIIGGLLIAAVYFTDTLVETIPIIAVLSGLAFYLMIPLVQTLLTKYQLNHSHYGNGQFATNLSAGKYYAIYLFAILWFLLAMALLGGIVWAAHQIFGNQLGIGNLEDIASSLENMADSTSMGQSITIIWGILLYAFLIIIGFLFTAYVKSKIRNYVFGRTKIDNRIAFRSTLKTFPYFSLKLTNLLIIVFTLGLGFPWTKVRTARYLANNTSLLAKDGLDGFLSDQIEYQSSLAEEMGDAFDMDLDLGM